MDIELIEDIATQLEIFSRNPKPLINCYEQVTSYKKDLDSGKMISFKIDDETLKVLSVAINFTVGCLEGYLDETLTD